MTWSEDLKERIQSGMKLLEPNLKNGKDFVETVLADLQKEAKAGRERVGEAKIDLEETVQQVGARAKLTGERIEEMIRQEIQRQVEAYFRKQRESLAKTFTSYANQIQKSILDVSSSLLGKSSDKDSVITIDTTGISFPSESEDEAQKEQAKSEKKELASETAKTVKRKVPLQDQTDESTPSRAPRRKKTTGSEA